MRNKVTLVLLMMINISFGQTIVKDSITALNPFKSITIKAALDVELIPSDEFKIKVVGDGVEDLTILNTNKELILKLPLIDKFTSKIKAKIYFKPGLRNLSIANNTVLHSETYIEEDFLEIEQLNNTKASLKLRVNNLNADVDLGSTLTLYGTAASQHIVVTNKSVFDAFNFKTENTHIEALKASKAGIYVSDYLDAKSTLKSEITYMGEPFSVNEKLKFLGKLIRKNEK